MSNTKKGSAPTPEKVHFSLLENGLDFIDHALELLDDSKGKPSARLLKYAVLHLAGGAELVLKERLRREHWTLVFDKPELATLEKYQSGSFKSAGFDECIDRLKGVCGVDFSKSRVALKDLRDRRNRIQHFGFSESYAAVVASTASATSVVLDFITEELEGATLSDAERELIEDIRKRLTRCQAFVKARWEVIKAEIESTKEPVVTCTSCLEKAAIVDGGVDCKFCRHRAGAEEAADSYLEMISGGSAYVTIKDGGEGPCHRCPDCGDEALIDIASDARPKSKFLCFGCGTESSAQSFDDCARCGRIWHAEEDGSTICDDCMDHIRQED
jgi:hypothetical protein